MHAECISYVYASMLVDSGRFASRGYARTATPRCRALSMAPKIGKGSARISAGEQPRVQPSAGSIDLHAYVHGEAPGVIMCSVSTAWSMTETSAGSAVSGLKKGATPVPAIVAPETARGRCVASYFEDWWSKAGLLLDARVQSAASPRHPIALQADSFCRWTGDWGAHSTGLVEEQPKPH